MLHQAVLGSWWKAHSWEPGLLCGYACWVAAAAEPLPELTGLMGIKNKSCGQQEMQFIQSVAIRLEVNVSFQNTCMESETSGHARCSLALCQCKRGVYPDDGK